MHSEEQLTELWFVKKTIAVLVLLLEFLRELAEEILMLRQLVIEDYLDKLRVFDFALEFDLFLLRLFLFAGKFALRLDAYEMVQRIVVGALSPILVDSARKEVRSEFILLGFLLVPYQVSHLMDQNLRISFVVHPHNDLLPDWFIELTDTILLFQPFNHCIQVRLTLQRELFTEDCFQYLQQGVLDVNLDVSEFFITLVLEDFSKESDFMVIFTMRSDSINDCGCPLHNKRLYSIFLNEESAHELLHCLNWKSWFAWFKVEFQLLVVHFRDNVFQLLDREYLATDAAILYSWKWRLLSYSTRWVYTNLLPGNASLFQVLLVHLRCFLVNGSQCSLILEVLVLNLNICRLLEVAKLGILTPASVHILLLDH